MRRRDSNAFRLRFGLLVAAAVSFVVAGLAMPEQISVLTYVSLALGIAGVVLFCARRWALSATGRRPDYWEPPTAYSFMALGYTVAGFVAFLTNDPRFRVPELGSDNGHLVGAAVLIAFALAALWVGYRAVALIGAVRKLSMARTVVALRRQLAKPDLAMTLVLYAIVAVVHVWQLSAGSGTFDAPGLGVAEHTVNVIVSLSYFILALVALQVFLTRWPPIVLYLVLVPEVFFASLTAFINSVVTIALIVIGALYYASPRFRARWLLFFAALVLMITPVTIAMRVQIRTGHASFGSVTDLADSAWRGFNDTWLTAPAEAANTTYSKLGGRTAGNIQILGVVLRYVPARTPFLGTQDLIQTPLFVVPRFFWPDKPSPTLIGGFTSLVFLNEDNNSVTPTTFGDLYLHGGVPTVAIGMFLLGVLLSIQYRFLAPRIDNSVSPVLLACWLSLVYSVINPESAYGSMIQALLQKPLVILSAAYLICSPRFDAVRRLVYRLRPLPA